MTLSLSDEDFGKMAAGKTQAQRLFMSGKLKIKGDVMKVCCFPLAFFSCLIRGRLERRREEAYIPVQGEEHGLITISECWGSGFLVLFVEEEQADLSMRQSRLRRWSPFLRRLRQRLSCERTGWKDVDPIGFRYSVELSDVSWKAGGNHVLSVEQEEKSPNLLSTFHFYSSTCRYPVDTCSLVKAIMIFLELFWGSMTQFAGSSRLYYEHSVLRWFNTYLAANSDLCMRW